MIVIEENSNELLNYAISHGILNLDSVRKSMQIEENNKYLSMHTYRIYQDKDGRWKTLLPDETKKYGRRLVAKKDKEVLEKEIVDFYKKQERDEQFKLAKEEESKKRFPRDITLEELYPYWFDSRVIEATNLRTVKRNDQDWRRYYVGEDIIKYPMADLTPNQLKDWANGMVAKHRLNKREYYNMALIIKKCYEFLADEGICDNVWSRVKVNTKKFRKTVKPDNDTQIFFDDEKEKILRYCLQSFATRPWNIGILALPLLFCTGMRIGEVVALKYSDLTETDIIVQREEVNDYEFDSEERKFKYLGKIVEDHCKTDAGVRTIPYTSSAKQIINLVRESSESYGYYNEGYIFCPGSKRITSNSIDRLLYAYCDKLDIPVKSAHKIRKTYISKLISNGIDLDTVCRVSGHADLKTTFESYLFCLDRKDKLSEKFNLLFERIV